MTRYYTFIFLILSRKIDWLSFVGIVGGYVGICLGFSLREIPTLINRISVTMRNFLFIKREDKEIHVINDAKYNWKKSTFKARLQKNYRHIYYTKC